MVDNVSYIQGSAQALVIIHCPHISVASLSKGWGGLEGCIGLPALQPYTLGGEGHGCLVYKYTWSLGCCATWCSMPVPLPCHSLVAFKPL